MAAESEIQNPKSKLLKILLIEDNPGDADLIEAMLNTANIQCELECASRLSAGIERLKAEGFALVLLDLGLPDSQGLVTLTKLFESGPKAPVIVLTGLVDEEVGTQAVKEGAQDYLIKGQIDHKLLARAIRHAIERAKLEAEREQYFRFFQTSTDLMCMADPNGAFIKTNPACSQTLGYTEAELVARPFLEFVHPDDKEATLAEMARQMRKGFTLNFENRYVCKDGSLRWLEWRATYKKDEGITYATARDITEVKQTAAALKSSEEFIKDILASVDEAFVVLDRDYRIVTANRAYCEQAGEALADIIGKHCYGLSHQTSEPCHYPEYICGGKHTFATGEPAVTVHTHTDARGKQRQVEVKTYPMKDESGVVTSIIEVINDITEKTVLESQLRQAQKMEAVGTLAGGIAHDFNNILTAILGFGEIVMEQLPADSQLREDQAHVVAAGKRARDLVKQILTFSRRAEQELQPLLMQFVVKEALKMLRASIPTSIEIREDIDVNCGAVLADPVQIHQVVMNLCTNAYQSMRETGGVLAVSLKSVVVSAEAAKMTVNLHPGPHLCLEVSDTGSGMSRAVRERIFEPYFTTKDKGEGTGLGLSLVHGIVAGLGGGVNVYSEPGRGSTFRVYLPLIAGEIPCAAEEKHEVLPGGSESIMVVDDEEFITDLERKILEGLGYRTTVCADGEQALLVFRERPDDFDLILTDMTMPRLNGNELAREILGIRPELPIVLCTGYSELIDAKKAKALGIREFLLKPVEKGELARAVRRALDGGTGADTRQDT